MDCVILKMDDFKIFTSTLLGIELQYPNNWNLLSTDDFYEQLENIKTENKYFNENVAKLANKPLLALSRYELDYDDLNPTFKISIKPYGAIKQNALGEILVFIFEQFKSIFKNFRVRIPPKLVQLDNKEAYYGKVYYSIKSTLDIEFHVCSEIWLIHKGFYFIMIAAATNHNGEKHIKDDINKIIKSLKIAD